jgi:hypothetical protein
VANVIYNSFFGRLMSGEIDLSDGGDTLNVVLVTSSYSPNIDTHTQYSHITNQVEGTGYTAGGKTLENQDVTVDTADDKAVFDADNVTWADSTITAKGAVIYKYIDDSGDPDDTSPLIAYLDFTTDKSSVEGNFTLNFDEDGIIILGQT